jgi:integrase
MPVYSRGRGKNKSWYYRFSAPGASRTNRRDCNAWGFKTKKEAQDAEAARRAEEQKKYELSNSGAAVAGELPKILGQLLEEFFTQREKNKKLEAKTLEGYRDDAARLAPELLRMELDKIKPLHFTREWTRLQESGGRKRGTGEVKPLSGKTVRNVAGMVSSAYAWGVREGLVTMNPVTHSERPKKIKRKGAALTTMQIDLLVESVGGPWCMPMFLDLENAVGARRGEALALRWSDYVDGRVTIERSLSQTARIVQLPDGSKKKTHDVLKFKGTKKGNIRVIALPSSTRVKLEEHRKQQNEFRRQYGSDYRGDLDLIFANPDGTPLKPNSISSTVSALFKRLGIAKPKGVALHVLRHSHGSHLLANGVPLPVVSERLGHDSVRTTAEIYSHAIHGQDDEAVEKWEEYQQRSRDQHGKLLQQ